MSPWFITLVFILLGRLTFSAGPFCASVFEKLYSAPEVYVAYQCAGNVRRLIEKMKAEGVDLEKAKVLFVLGEKYTGNDVPIVRVGMLSPKQSRSSGNILWPIHVVLEVEGQIYDLDFAGRNLPTKDYFNAMFPKSERHPEGNPEKYLLVRPLPAAVFVSDFDQLGENGAVEKYSGKPNDGSRSQYRTYLEKMMRSAPGVRIQPLEEYLNPK